MSSIRISDSYDNDTAILSSFTQSLNKSVKPKFISSFEEI